MKLQELKNRIRELEIAYHDANVVRQTLSGLQEIIIEGYSVKVFDVEVRLTHHEVINLVSRTLGELEEKQVKLCGELNIDLEMLCDAHQ